MQKLALLIVLVGVVAWFSGEGHPRSSATARQISARAQAPSAQGSRKFTSPTTGEVHEIVPTGELFESKEAPERAAAEGDNYAPSTMPERLVAKLSFVKTPPDIFAHLDNLRKSLPADAVMQKHDPLIKRDTNFDRVAEEKRNVRVTAFIYALSHEGDNDFHVIIGGDLNDPDRLYMNVEVSGLPKDGPFRAQLKKARDQFKAYFGNHLPANPGFHEIKPPVPVQVTGSLFYDISHKPDAPGPKAHKPHTSWEIHPVTDIQFPKKMDKE
jgi:hypothetical protein